jgi:hypothetical protein
MIVSPLWSALTHYHGNVTSIATARNALPRIPKLSSLRRIGAASLPGWPRRLVARPL